MAKLLEAQIYEETKLWSLIILCLSRSKYARKEQWRRGKQGTQLQSFIALLEHLPKSIFYILYTISKLRNSRIQRFKPCMIWSWNEKDMTFGRQLHQAVRNFRTMEIKVRNPQPTVRHFRTPQINVRNWNFSVRNLDIFADSFSSDIFVSKFPFSPCIQPLM